ncbi:MAG: STAS/SEC14 domain-containing protein [Gammaproteobacteria bacterium]
MFKVDRAAPNRLDIAVSGKLNGDEMAVALDELIAAADSIEQGRMLYLISDFNFPSLAAIGVELSRLPALFKLARKFERAAVVADEAWIRTLSEWEGHLFPGLEIRGFTSVEEAEDWLAA